LCEELDASSGITPHTPEAVQWGGLSFNPSFLTALQYLPPDEALQLFERQDSKLLGDLELFVDRFLARAETPFYTHEELEQLIGQFINHQNNNAPLLLESGLPQSAFETSRWLDAGLNSLYPTKLPFVSWKNPDCRTTQALFHCWIANPTRDLDSAKADDTVARRSLFGPRRYSLRSSSSPIVVDGETLECCSYAQTPTLPGLQPSDIAHLEQGRTEFLALKRAVLTKLHQALQCRDADTLWQACFDEIFKRFNFDKFFFYWRLDKAYAFWASAEQKLLLDALTPKRAAKYAVLSSGGLTNLVKLIAHCERELKVRALHQIKERLPRIHGSPSIYKFIDSHAWPLIAGCASDFRRSATRECEHQQIFAARMRRSLEMLRVPLQIETEVMGTLAKDFCAAAQNQMELLKYMAETSGHVLMPTTTSSGNLTLAAPVASEVTDPADRNRVTKEGEFWRVKYDGKSIAIADSKGIQYIAYLVHNPARLIHCSELRAYGHLGDARYMDANVKDAERRESVKANKGREILDQRARDDYERRISEVHQELAEAERFNDTGRALKAKQELAWLVSELQKATGLGGRSRILGDPNERSRKIVQRLIQNALKRLDKEYPALGRHLREKIRTGMFCEFTPDPAAPWSS
jgi:hypothetical protein